MTNTAHYSLHLLLTLGTSVVTHWLAVIAFATSMLLPSLVTVLPTLPLFHHRAYLGLIQLRMFIIIILSIPVCPAG
jgi:hypothetical protein